MKKTITAVSIKFPSQFAQFINNIEQVEFEGETIRDLVNYLDSQFGRNIKERLLDDHGELKTYINLFIGRKNIRSLDNLESIIPQGEKISMLLSRAGG